jgi:hypothetical protein
MLMRTTKRPQRSRTVRWGFGLGLLLALAAVAPGLTQEAGDEPKSPGYEMASRAGCDLSQNDVPMNVTTFDRYFDPATGAPLGDATLEEAVVGLSKFLAEDGAVFSDEELREAAREAKADAGTIQVRLAGVSIEVQQWNDSSYVVTEVIQCA